MTKNIVRSPRFPTQVWIVSIDDTLDDMKLITIRISFQYLTDRVSPLTIEGVIVRVQGVYWVEQILPNCGQ